MLKAQNSYIYESNQGYTVSQLVMPEFKFHKIQHNSHTHQFNSPFLGLPGWAGTRKVKPIWIFLNQETVSGSGISWAMCKSAPRSRQITKPAPHHSPHQIQRNSINIRHYVLLTTLNNAYLCKLCVSAKSAAQFLFAGFDLEILLLEHFDGSSLNFYGDGKMNYCHFIYINSTLVDE